MPVHNFFPEVNQQEPSFIPLFNMRVTKALSILPVVLALIITTDATKTADNDKNNVKTTDVLLNEERYAYSGGNPSNGTDYSYTQAWTNFKKWFKKTFFSWRKPDKRRRLRN
ncbi:hypothetical protein JG687_00002712 [Phytophthora cactorum]|uniref:Uncharacterized protein n=1 Tax=Phytophthora cactorum TaxID=29920 RepID=A0A8T1UTJ4_9STRA|nr:hypothetical protein GQ600_20612 [Phytophthora cactorum]KAG6970297.1 hypothetical protein JG687_00002712 [Phytophthora cactorum]